MPPNPSNAASSLCQVAQLWRDASDSSRKKALDALTVSTGFSERLIELGLENAFGVVTAQALPTDPVQTPRTVLIVCPSNVFTAWLPPALLALALGHTVWLKPSVHEPVFPSLWRESVERIDPVLAERIKLVPWTAAIREAADAFIAYGSDETIVHLRNAVRTKPFIGYGHQISVGIVFKDALDPKNRTNTHQSIQAAVEPFRLQGCLSPQVLYIQENSDGGGSGSQGLDFIHKSEPRLPLPLPQLLSFNDEPQLLHLLSAIPDRLACVGGEGNTQALNRLSSTLKRLGVSRVCPLAEMQRPPLHWPNAGIDLVEWLQF